MQGTEPTARLNTQSGGGNHSSGPQGNALAPCPNPCSQLDSEDWTPLWLALTWVPMPRLSLLERSGPASGPWATLSRRKTEKFEHEVTVSPPGWFPLHGAIFPILKILSFCGATQT